LVGTEGWYIGDDIMLHILIKSHKNFKQNEELNIRLLACLNSCDNDH